MFSSAEERLCPVVQALMILPTPSRNGGRPGQAAAVQGSRTSRGS